MSLPSKRKWTPEEIKELTVKDDKAVMRAIVRLYNLQTAQEQQIGETKESNKVGFNGPDGPRLSYYAKWIQEKGPLTGTHINHARNRVKKYAGQLAKIANGELNA